MINLVIDTATKYLYIALVQDKNVIDSLQIEGLKNHAGMSVYSIDKMLKKNGFSINDLNAIYCGYGPGSYTGVRISVTIAKMITSFKNIPLYSISSLYLAGSGYDNKNVAVMFDARRGNSFCACYGEHNIEDKLRNAFSFQKMLEGFEDVIIVTEDNYNVNPLRVIEKATLIKEVDGFVPNYLRISEAEYNLEHKND